jgi:hypothetical protein
VFTSIPCPRRRSADTSPSRMRSTRTPPRKSRARKRSDMASPGRTLSNAGWTERGSVLPGLGPRSWQASTANGMTFRHARDECGSMEGPRRCSSCKVKRGRDAQQAKYSRNRRPELSSQVAYCLESMGADG